MPPFLPALKPFQTTAFPALRADFRIPPFLLCDVVEARLLIGEALEKLDYPRASGRVRFCHYGRLWRA